jgi:hypothetical protein
MPYVEGERDCAAFAELVLRDQFGRDVRLPAERAEGLRGQSAQIVSLAGDYADRVNGEPKEGDAVLMMARGRLAHVGILCLIGGRRYVLHACRAAGQVVRHTLRDLERLNLPVEGYYRWR